MREESVQPLISLHNYLHEFFNGRRPGFSWATLDCDIFSKFPRQFNRPHQTDNNPIDGYYYYIWRNRNLVEIMSKYLIAREPYYKYPKIEELISIASKSGVEVDKMHSRRKELELRVWWDALFRSLHRQAVRSLKRKKKAHP